MNLYIFLQVLYLLAQNDVRPEFTSQTLDSKVAIGYGVALGDVDGDGKPDVIMADKKQFVWYRNGDWKKIILAENLTEFDNVAIAARDITGDGKVEIAVGAQWNPSETSDITQSGSVHYLARPSDPTSKWKAIKLPHEPTVHRMKWVKDALGKFHLVVLPLHGRGNKNGEGAGVNVMAYEFPQNPESNWETFTIDQSMHLTHNFEVVETPTKNLTEMYIAGKDGIRYVRDEAGIRADGKAAEIPGMNKGAGEVKVGNLAPDKQFIATVEPMHGDEIVVYLRNKANQRVLLDNDVKEAHALATGDFLGMGSDQVVAGWRGPNKDGKVGVKIYVSQNTEGTAWKSYWIDENEMACEDIQVMDLDGDGKLDIVASGRATGNLKVYWNKTGR